MSARSFFQLVVDQRSYLANRSGGSFHRAQGRLGDRAGPRPMATMPGLDHLPDPVRLEHLTAWPRACPRRRSTRWSRHRGHVARPSRGTVRPSRAPASGCRRRPCTLTSSSSRCTDCRSSSSTILSTLMSLLSCLVTCSSGCSSTFDHDGDARDLLVLGRPDRERVDVEAAPGEQPGDAGQHARLVLDEHRQRVGRGCGGGSHGHYRSIRRSDGCRGRTGCRRCWRPAATIGHTMASWRTMKSITTGGSLIAIACSMAASTSALVSQRSPTQP